VADRTTDMTEDLWGYGKRLRFVVESIEAVLADKPAAEISILDVGCGTAALLGIPLAERRYRLTGVDFHEPSIEIARRNAKDLPNANFICGDVEDLNGWFDVVILSEVLEHVADPASLLASGIAKMKPDGLMIVTVPNGYGEFEWDSWFFKGVGLERLVDMYIEKKARNGSAPVVSSTENHDNRHIQFFTLRRLSIMFSEAGLKIVGQQGSTLMSGPLAGHILARSASFIEWNARIADRLPMSMSSGWYFALRQSEAAR
jgi:2-polyprenyl-3-methyl-5-hydroxy-6-metoxy-1,4-benzoquinol methylase